MDMSQVRVAYSQAMVIRQKREPVQLMEMVYNVWRAWMRWLARKMPTTSSKPFNNYTPSPLTGPVSSSANSPLTGTMPHAHATSPCPNISKQPFTNSNIRRPNACNTPHTPGQNQTMGRMCNMHRTTILLLSCLQNNQPSTANNGKAPVLFNCVH